MPLTCARSSTRKSSWKMPRRTTPCGTPRKCRWSSPAGCTTTCACTGQKRSWSGPGRRRTRTRSQCGSTTSTNSTAETPTATPGSPGRSSASSTAPGSSAPSSGKSAKCGEQAREEIRQQDVHCAVHAGRNVCGVSGERPIVRKIFHEPRPERTIHRPSKPWLGCPQTADEAERARRFVCHGRTVRSSGEAVPGRPLYRCAGHKEHRRLVAHGGRLVLVRRCPHLRGHFNAHAQGEEPPV